MKTVVFAVLLSMVPGAAVAKDILPLQHGLYVAAPATCDQMGAASALGYYGTTLHAAQTISETRVLGHHGATYRLRTKMTDMSGQPLNDFVETVVIGGEKQFDLTTPFGKAKYSWCSSDGTF